MTDLEKAARMALEALEVATTPLAKDRQEVLRAQAALRQALEQPEFFTHSVEQPYDWSEWVCPDPKSYLMKCCDCGLVHETQFGVVRYKSENEREDCEKVDDPNLQAVFRMRRSEQWSPEDTAHRAGGLPMEQPAQQQEPVRTRAEFEMWAASYSTFSLEHDDDPARGITGYKSIEQTMLWHAWQAAKTKAPEGASGGESGRETQLDLAETDCTHKFQIAPSSGIKICVNCGLSEMVAQKKAQATSPQRKPWVGLTWDDMPDSSCDDPAFLAGAQWANSKLKEKNA